MRGTVTAWHCSCNGWSGQETGAEMQQPDVETMLRLNGVSIAPDRVEAIQEAYDRWLQMTAILREPFPTAEEPLFPPAGPR